MSRLINELKSSFPKLRFIRRLPTYDMQGTIYMYVYIYTLQSTLVAQWQMQFTEQYRSQLKKGKLILILILN